MNSKPGAIRGRAATVLTDFFIAWLVVFLSSIICEVVFLGPYQPDWIGPVFKVISGLSIYLLCTNLAMRHCLFNLIGKLRKFVSVLVEDNLLLIVFIAAAITICILILSFISIPCCNTFDPN